jgi:hypothetical protein
VAVNEIGSLDNILCLLKHDTVYGRDERQVEAVDGKLGMVPGASLSADQLGARLRRLGVPSDLTARDAAWSALALEVPAVVLAEKLGIAISTAERWHAALGGYGPSTFDC